MIKKTSTAMLLVLLIPGFAFAGEAAQSISAGDTAWVLTSTALVMLMTPGLALFYGGMVRGKNILSTVMYSFFILCLISVQWVLWGYSLSFGADVAGIIGNLSYLGLTNVGVEANGTIPHLVFMMYQGMFAVITVALITGTFVERFKFSALIIFALLWTTIVYDPLAHWVWGGGWIAKTGALDFAGGTVVHISSGISALVAALFVGRRKGYMHESMAPHNLPMTVLGTALLWFGWFGFNAGSALGANGLAAVAFVATNTAAAAGALAWVFVEWAFRGKPTVLGAVSGAVAGLVAITPGAGYVGPLSAIIIGLIGGSLCYCSVSYLKPALGYDDSLDVFGIHGIGGIWGALATGLFASVGEKGLFFGNPGQLWAQVIGVVGTIVFAGVATFIILAVIKAVVGLRVTQEEEVMGLDISQHGEAGYTS
ncbi:MAG: ammonium transporter [Thermodesulfobacteriota bacterium]|nr:MAG: ammonium transporter [Thermodesulfobacteriota bacterium]